MGLDLGIVGLPNVGKSTLFKAITAKQVEAANYPFCTIEPNIGVVKTPDIRLEQLVAVFESEKIVHNLVNIVDIAGLVSGASKGEGLGNKFLENIRHVDAIMQVVRCFSDKNVVHVDHSLDALRDIQTIGTELMLADLEIVEKFLSKETKLAKNNVESQAHVIILDKLYNQLQIGEWLNKLDILDNERDYYKQLPLLTSKPMFFVLNVDENLDLDNSLAQAVLAYAKKENIPTQYICANIEADIAELPIEERAQFFNAIGINGSRLDLIIDQGYSLLNQLVFYTAGKKEAHAWNIQKGASLPQAAGKIHSDMERGFIKGEVYNFADIKAHKSESVLRSLGKIRIEGKSYLMQDGDVINIRFAV